MQYDKVSDFAFFNIQTFLRNSYIHAHIMYQRWVPQSDVMHNTNTYMGNTNSFLTNYK
jgi:hypothetical protein